MDCPGRITTIVALPVSHRDVACHAAEEGLCSGVTFLRLGGSLGSSAIWDGGNPCSDNTTISAADQCRRSLGRAPRLQRPNHAQQALTMTRSGLASLVDLGKIRAMAGPTRVTGPLLDVLEVFLQGLNDDVELHGWAIVKSTKRSGPTTYGVLDRLEDAGWITGRWEDQPSESNRPRRRLYRLTPTGAVAARDLLAARRPQALLRRHRLAPGVVFVSRLRAVLAGSAR